jgi:hypothetical protein
VLLLVVLDQRGEDLEPIVLGRAGLGGPEPLDLLERGTMLLLVVDGFQVQLPPGSPAVPALQAGDDHVAAAYAAGEQADAPEEDPADHSLADSELLLTDLQLGAAALAGPALARAADGLRIHLGETGRFLLSRLGLPSVSGRTDGCHSGVVLGLHLGHVLLKLVPSPEFGLDHGGLERRERRRKLVVGHGVSGIGKRVDFQPAVEIL